MDKQSNGSRGTLHSGCGTETAEKSTTESEVETLWSSSSFTALNRPCYYQVSLELLIIYLMDKAIASTEIQPRWRNVVVKITVFYLSSGGTVHIHCELLYHNSKP